MALLPTFFREAKGTLALAVPIIAGQVSQMLLGVVDSVMVGRLGTVPLAASAFANSLLAVPLLFGIGLLQCISVRAAEAHGAGDQQETGEVLRHGLALSLLTAVLMVVLTGWVSVELTRFGQPPEVAAEARIFFLLVGVSQLPMLMAMSLRQYSEALNHPWPPMLIMLGSVLLNVGFNWVFIYGNLGSPSLGLAGAGIATLLARVLTFWGILAYVLRARRFSGTLPEGWMRPLHAWRIWSLLRIGLPAGGQLLLEVSAFTLAAIMVGWIGAEALAAHQIALTCTATAFMFPLGIAMAVSIQIGHANGASNRGRVRTLGLVALTLSALMMTASALLFAGFGGLIARVFVEDPKVTVLAGQLLLIAAVFQWVDGLQVVGAGILRALNDATTSMWICLFTFWVVFPAFAYVAAFRFHWGTFGIWAGLALALAVTAALLILRFWKLTAPAPIRSSA